MSVSFEGVPLKCLELLIVHIYACTGKATVLNCSKPIERSLYEPDGTKSRRPKGIEKVDFFI
jgi:hypothetical protein